MAARNAARRAMRTVLITGANRGLGLALVRRYGEAGWRVWACCRAPARASELRALARASGGRVSVRALDVTRGAQVARLARSFGRRRLDLLINNAGIYAGHYRANLGQTDYGLWAKACATNVMGPARMAAAFAPALARSPKGTIVNISSIMGSIALTSAGSSYAYRSTKAALNMVTKTLALELKPWRITVAAIHPGWVRTDMGGAKAPLSPKKAAAEVVSVIAGLGRRDSGGFFSHTGRPLPW